MLRLNSFVTIENSTFYIKRWPFSKIWWTFRRFWLLARRKRYSHFSASKKNFEVKLWSDATLWPTGKAGSRVEVRGLWRSATHCTGTWCEWFYPSVSLHRASKWLLRYFPVTFDNVVLKGENLLKVKIYSRLRGGSTLGISTNEFVALFVLSCLHWNPEGIGK